MQYFKYIRETIEPLNSIVPYDTCTIYTTYCVMNRVRESAWHKQRKMKLTPTYLLHHPPSSLPLITQSHKLSFNTCNSRCNKTINYLLKMLQVTHTHTHTILINTVVIIIMTYMCLTINAKIFLVLLIIIKLQNGIL